MHLTEHEFERILSRLDANGMRDALRKLHEHYRKMAANRRNFAAIDIVNEISAAVYYADVSATRECEALSRHARPTSGPTRDEIEAAREDRWILDQARLEEERGLLPPGGAQGGAFRSRVTIPEEDE